MPDQHMSPQLGTVMTSTLLALACAGSAFAAEPLIVGPRSLGMGGTGVAVADDWTAAYYNPAVFGFFGKTTTGETTASDVPSRYDNNDLARRGFFGLNLIDLQIGLRQFGDMGDILQNLSDNIDVLDDLSNNGVQTTSDLESLVLLTSELTRADNPGNAIGLDANAGAGIRLGNFGIGIRTWAQAIGLVDNVDLVNLGISNAGGGSLSADIDATGSPLAGSIQLLQGLDLDGNPGVDSNAELALEFQAQQLGLSAEEAADLVTLLNAANAQYNTAATLSDNQTRVVLSGFSMFEIPISYGHMLNEQWSVGGSLRLLVGRVHRSTVLIFDDENNDFSKVFDEYEQSANFGIDIGTLYRLPYLNLGLDIRNLNAPSFSAPSGGEDVTLDPQITFGAGFFPFKSLGIAFDIDLLKSEAILADYDVQRAMIGLEWDAFRFLALRVGGYTNLAESDVGNVITAGLGLNFWLLRLDFGGAMALDTVNVDGSDVPRELRFAFRLASEW